MNRCISYLWTAMAIVLPVTVLVTLCPPPAARATTITAMNFTTTSTSGPLLPSPSGTATYDSTTGQITLNLEYWDSHTFNFTGHPIAANFDWSATAWGDHPRSAHASGTNYYSLVINGYTVTDTEYNTYNRFSVTYAAGYGSVKIPKPVSQTPEPGTAILVGLGLICLIGLQGRFKGQIHLA